ncbi:MAG: flagellar motor switch protein FliN [Chloroflexota bacterium]|nr:flagellar motor switch protein FliN [Chloroflexota bacterium]
MSARNANDKNMFAEGDLSQDLIDQMLSGGEVAGAAEDPWSDEALQAEIEAARLAAGLAEAAGRAPVAPAGPSLPAMPTPISAAPSAAASIPTAVHPVQFMPLTPESPSTERAHGIEMLMDVALEVSVELGRSHMSIGEILALRTGSVIELDKLAGEPVDVSVNGTLIARGEVVVVDEKFGVRITEVVSKARRIASLG